MLGATPAAWATSLIVTMGSVSPHRNRIDSIDQRTSASNRFTVEGMVGITRRCGKRHTGG
ncbi:hypothetical protein GCM10027570_14830 [Streptomonospora sediminis]